MKNICARERAGFTLVEMLTVFAILIIVGYALSVLFQQATKSYSRIRASQEIVDIERNVVTTLLRDLENAFVSSTDPRFRFIGNNVALHFNAFQENATGIPSVVEIGYAYDAVNRTINRRMQTGATIPDADVTSGGITSPLGRNIHSLAFRIGYRHTGVTINYIVSGSTWDSQLNTYANYNTAHEEKNPDGLPHLIEVTFALSDSQNQSKLRTVTTTIYLPNDK
jgi:type II secretory pathway pseudopilin PulG